MTAVVMDFKGATFEPYDQTLDKVPSGPWAVVPRVDASAGSPTPHTGPRITDVSESRERFDEFARDQIGPITAQD